MAVFPVPGGHLHAERSGHKHWGTDEPPFLLLPPSDWQEIPVSILFSDFVKDVVYGFNLFTSPPPLSITNMYGLSIVKIRPQETWFADQVIGTVPAGCNYVDWRVNLTNTVVPSQARGAPVRSPIRPGVDTDLRGGSGLIEIVPGCFSRFIHVDVDGTDIVLKRKQSARNQITDVSPSIWSPDNGTHYPGGGPREAFTYGTQIEGTFVHKIDGVRAGNNAWRGGSNGASLVDPTNYASTWTGTLLVKPGRYNPSI